MGVAQASTNNDVRAIAAGRLNRIAARAGAASANDTESAHRALLANDIKRFRERGYEADQLKTMAAAPAPPGAPIGDFGQNWLGSPTVCNWDDNNPWLWLYYRGGDQ